MLYGPELSTALREFEERFGNICEEESHHDTSITSQQHFQVDVRNLVEVMRALGNPFCHSTKELLTLHTKVHQEDCVIECIKVLEKNGKDACEAYTNEVLVNRRRSINQPIKRQKLSLFGATQDCEKIVVKTVPNAENLLSKLLAIQKTRSMHMHELFAHEFYPTPLALATTGGDFYRGKKSDILKCLEKECPLKGTKMAKPECVIVDGNGLLHRLQPLPKSTFEEYITHRFIPELEVLTSSAKRLDLVWDTYQQSSLKMLTRQSRGNSASQTLSPELTTPSKWHDFLKNSDNKVQLHNMIDAAVSSHSFNGRQVVLSSGTAIINFYIVFYSQIKQ